MLRNLAIGLALLIGAAVLLGAAIGRLLPSVRVASLDASALPEGWRPVDWPLIKDQFDAGLALECLGSGCANFSAVTVRAKIGFCNCVSGVSDDDELERIGDAGAISEAYVPLGAGQETVVDGLKGRERLYRLNDQPVLLSLAYSHRCDAIAVTARGFEAGAAAQQVKQLLESRAVRDWVDARLNR